MDEAESFIQYKFTFGDRLSKKCLSFFINNKTNMC